MELADMKSTDQVNETCSEFVNSQLVHRGPLIIETGDILCQTGTEQPIKQEHLTTHEKDQSPVNLPQKGMLYNILVQGGQHTEPRRPCLHEHAARCKCKAVNVKHFKCGGCLKSYTTICKLHEHLNQAHMESDMYFFDKITQTAFPRYGSSCKVTQTDTEMLCFEKECKIEENEEAFYDKDLEDIGEVEVKVLCSDTADSSDDKDEKALSSDIMESNLHEEQINILNVQDVAASNIDTFSNMNEICEVVCLQVDDVVKTELAVAGNVSHNKTCKQSKRKKRVKTHFQRKKKRNQKKKVCNSKIKNRNTNAPSLVVDEIKTEQKETPAHSLKLRSSKTRPKKSTQCEVCDKTFSNRGKCHTHYVAVHLRAYKCDQCEITCSTPLKLNKHKEDVHASVNYVCQFCGEGYTTRLILRLHIKRTHRIPPHLCPQEKCGKRFRSRYQLTTHMRKHTGETPFMCDVCGRGFMNSGLLRSHSNMHSTEQNAKCDQCPKAFVTDRQLRRHQRIHKQDKPHVCNECGKAFTNNWNLKAHQRQHTGEKPYCCDICGAGFTHNISRKNHMKVHLEEPQ